MQSLELRNAGHWIQEHRQDLAAAVAQSSLAAAPEAAVRYGPKGLEKCCQDIAYHLDYLVQSLICGRPGLFSEYLAWAKIMLERRNIPAQDLVGSVRRMAECIAARLPAPEGSVAAAHIEQALQAVKRAEPSPPTFLRPSAPLADLAREYLDALLRGDRSGAATLVLRASEQGALVKDLYLHVFQTVQREIGRLWQMNEITVAQEHYCTAASQLILSQLYPRLFAGRRVRKRKRVLVAACVHDELHELGIRMVADFFEMAGWDTYYLGANVPAESVVAAVAERKADLLGVSTTILSRVGHTRRLIAAVRGSKDAGRIKILAGGYPFNIEPDLWRDIGADAAARDAEEAVATGERLLARPVR